MVSWRGAGASPPLNKPLFLSLISQNIAFAICYAAFWYNKLSSATAKQLLMTAFVNCWCTLFIKWNTFDTNPQKWLMKIPWNVARFPHEKCLAHMLAYDSVIRQYTFFIRSIKRSQNSVFNVSPQTVGKRTGQVPFIVQKFLLLFMHDTLKLFRKSLFHRINHGNVQ